jgi:hypothetical protein
MSPPPAVSHCGTKGGQENHTVSKRPARIRSVVLWMFPPLRCRAHKMLRLSTCGNICCILCTATSLDLSICSAVRTGGRSGLGPEKKRYRTISPDTIRTMAKKGSEICSSDMMGCSRPRLRCHFGGQYEGDFVDDR